MNGKGCIGLFLGLCVATLFIQTVSSVGFELLEIPLKCYKRHDHGTGKRKLPAYGYKPKLNRCVQFIYSGEGGNDNNFDSMVQCEAVCSPPGPKMARNVRNLVRTTTPSPKILAPTVPKLKIPASTKLEKRQKNKIRQTFNKLITEWTNYFRMLFAK